MKQRLSPEPTSPSMVASTCSDAGATRHHQPRRHRMKPLIDHDAIAEMFKQATAAQGETLRVAVCQVTLKALQGREFTLANTQKVIEAVTAAATSGASQNSGRAADMATLLNKAFFRHGCCAAASRRGQPPCLAAVCRPWSRHPGTATSICARQPREDGVGVLRIGQQSG